MLPRSDVAQARKKSPKKAPSSDRSKSPLRSKSSAEGKTSDAPKSPKKLTSEANNANRSRSKSRNRSKSDASTTPVPPTSPRKQASVEATPSGNQQKISDNNRSKSPTRSKSNAVKATVPPKSPGKAESAKAFLASPTTKASAISASKSKSPTRSKTSETTTNRVKSPTREKTPTETCRAKSSVRAKTAEVRLKSSLEVTDPAPQPTYASSRPGRSRSPMRSKSCEDEPMQYKQVRSVSPSKKRSTGSKMRRAVCSLSPTRTKSKDSSSSDITKKPLNYRPGDAPKAAPIYALQQREFDIASRMGHEDDDAFQRAVHRCIPANFTLIATVDDTSEAQEAYHAASLFDLPNAIGREGGVGTSALLLYMYEHIPELCGKPPPGVKRLSCRTVLREMHKGMKKTKIDNCPQMSSSRPLGPPRLKSYSPFYLVPPEFSSGTKRGLLIGVNFEDDPKMKLRAPHNDTHNVQQFLLKCGFLEGSIMMLKDDGKHMQPTKKNIETCFAMMVKLSQPGDVLFVQYSGHGGLVKDESGDEESGFDSCIFPVDWREEGRILDDDILKDLIKAVPEGVHTTMLVDWCHSGTVGDLPYILKADRKNEEIESYFDTQTRQEILEAELHGNREKRRLKHAKLERRKELERKRKQREEEMATRNEEKQTLKSAVEQYKNALFAVTEMANRLADTVESGAKSALQTAFQVRKKEADEAKAKVDNIRKSIRQSHVNLDFDSDDEDYYYEDSEGKK